MTRLRTEFEPLRAQLLARHPCVTLMEAITEVRNEETRLLDAGLLQYSSVLAVGSPSSWSLAPPSVPSSTTPPSSMAPSPGNGGGKGLQCDYCGRSGHVEAFCYRKRKAQARRSS